MTPEHVLSLSPVMPVVVIDDAAHAAPMARALLAGGVRTIEITLRTAAALEAIRLIRAQVPDAVVGAGTILNEMDLNAAIDAGAAYALSPGGTPALMQAAKAAGIPFIPGVATSSEIMTGFDLGYTCFKFFPAENAGGVGVLKSLASPLPKAKFCPTGGIGPDKIASYLALPNVMCVGGSWITPADKMKAGDWGAIEALAKQAAAFGKS
ncbi:MAG TPA: bifunctional 4-hydroxy-2-oxoglutarate aldolase/2-dehydro-3-deoxy-phosphogluconate aldolase [Caulobacterales bacterium]|nr:bifunctional 4-hydroxy-2-oxoglutarate aldolase/2-dehydro-3-deoxy-phosphogluconate aldolase [Caulobacterales bacterium]